VTGRLTQSIYYARNIAAAAAGANTVTVRFSTAAIYVDIRILEYCGLDPTNPLDVTAGAAGTGTAADSGTATTTTANDLIFGAATTTTGARAGTGFTSRIVTTPDEDLAEDKVVSATGSQRATASISPSGAWVMQMVAFRGASGRPDTQPPTAPTNLTAVVSGRTVQLNWTASPGNQLEFRVYRRQQSGKKWLAWINITGTAAISYTDPVPTVGKYQYYVTVYKNYLESTPSNTVTVNVRK
jgi:hypothetical protein